MISDNTEHTFLIVISTGAAFVILLVKYESVNDLELLISFILINY